MAKAKRAWKERNAVPVTAKAAKDMRPTGRGGFGTGQQQQGRGGAAPPGVPYNLHPVRISATVRVYADTVLRTFDVILASAGRGGRGGAAGRRPSGSGKAIPLVPQQRGGGANSNSGPGSERTAWLLLIGMLEKKCAAQHRQHPAGTGVNVVSRVDALLWGRSFYFPCMSGQIAAQCIT